MGYEPPIKGLPFIAYEKKSRPAAGPDGQTVRARPSVYVREHVNVKVAAYKEKTKATDNGPFKTGRVTFDAESVGLEHDFHGSIEAGSTAAQLLAEAFKNDTPVTVAIETSRRRYAPQGGGDSISPLTPIHELRGIVGDSTKANAEVTNRNCRNLVIAVNGEFTSELVSDPEEWELLRENRHGDLAPDGWAVFQGAIIPAASGSGNADTGQIEAAIEAALKKHFGTAKNTPAVPARAERPPQRDAHSAEAKPWERWNSDGRFNFGSYLATAARETYAQAHRMASAAKLDPAENPAAMDTLVRLLMGMADRIQLGVYRNLNGTPVRADRSHHEAREWIEFVVANVPGMAYTADMADPDDAQAVTARNAWANKVIATAGPLMDAVASMAETNNRNTGPTGLPVIRPITKELASRYDALLAHPEVSLKGWEKHVHHLLRARFGTEEFERIEAALFTAALTEWEADPAAFQAAARAAKDAAEPAAIAA